VKDAAKHPLVAAAEGQIEALFGCPALRGPHKPLAKIEALQGGPRTVLYSFMKGYTHDRLYSFNDVQHWYATVLAPLARIHIDRSTTTEL
jgi:hypothetical protein